MISATEEVAVREWVRVPDIPGLYRNTVSGWYYGFKKIRGRRKERSLRRTDRKIAKRLQRYRKSPSAACRPSNNFRPLWMRFARRGIQSSLTRPLILSNSLDWLVWARPKRHRSYGVTWTGGMGASASGAIRLMHDSMFRFIRICGRCSNG